MNDKVYRFDAVIQKDPGIDAAYVVFPCDIREAFGKTFGDTVAVTIRERE